METTAAVTTAPKKKNIPSLDLMKFMGILIVVFYHCRLVIVPTILTDRSLDQYVFYGILTLIGPCVPFFFLVTGYLMMGKPLDMKKHTKRTVHFVVLALFWSFVTLALTVLATGWMEFDLKYVLKHSVLMDTGWHYHLWFMGAMVILYIFFPLIKSAWDHNRQGLYFFLAICFLMTFGNRLLNMAYNVYGWLRYGVNVVPDYNFFSLFNPFRGYDSYVFIYFCLGAIIREHQEKFTEIMKPWICIVGIIVTTAALYLYGYFMSLSTGVIWQSGDQCGNDVIFSLIRVLCIFGLASRYKGTGRCAKLINYISANTMGIYFIHYVLRNVTVWKLQEVAIPGYFFKTLLYSIVLFGASWGLLELFKRTPILKKLIT